MDGSASDDPDGTTLTYNWALTIKPQGSTAVLSNSQTATPSITTDQIGDYLIQLIVSDGELPRVADTVVITAFNSPPVANAGADQTVDVQTAVNLDGSASFDPEGSSVTYNWAITSKPVGSITQQTSTSAASSGFFADVPGDYTIQLTITDALGAASNDQLTVSVNAPPLGQNIAPYLAAIGDQSVALGSVLTLQLLASDPNGDPVGFSASPVPLPQGASIAANGSFVFAPGAAQVGTLTLTFMVSDGLLTTSETINITVTGDPQPGMTALSGTVFDANAKENGQDVPVVGATVSVLGTAVTVITDANGAFTLNAIATTDIVFDIDASTAAPASGGDTYGNFRKN